MPRARVSCWNNAPPWPVPYHDSLGHGVERWISAGSTEDRWITANWSPEVFRNQRERSDIEFIEQALALEFDLECSTRLSRAAVKTHSTDNCVDRYSNVTDGTSRYAIIV